MTVSRHGWCCPSVCSRDEKEEEECRDGAMLCVGGRRGGEGGGKRRPTSLTCVWLQLPADTSASPAPLHLFLSPLFSLLILLPFFPSVLPHPQLRGG